jgi:hypothetical protein
LATHTLDLARIFHRLTRRSNTLGDRVRDPGRLIHLPPRGDLSLCTLCIALGAGCSMGNGPLDSDPDSDPDTDSNPDTDSDPDTDCDSDSDSDSDSDTDSDTDAPTEHTKGWEG